MRIPISFAVRCVFWRSVSCRGQPRPKILASKINRYELRQRGSGAFRADYPWYCSSTRYFAAGVTLNHAHNPLVYGYIRPQQLPADRMLIIEHQLLGHVYFWRSFLD